MYKPRCLYTEFSIKTPWFVHRMVERWESSRNFFFSLRNLASTFSLVFVVFLQPPSERASVKYILFYAQISFLERLYIASSISSATIFRCMALSDDVILNPATIAEGSSSRGGTLSSGGVISPFWSHFGLVWSASSASTMALQCAEYFHVSQQKKSSQKNSGLLRYIITNHTKRHDFVPALLAPCSENRRKTTWARPRTSWVAIRGAPSSLRQPRPANWYCPEWAPAKVSVMS